jgi:5-methylcytosine-specific restriction endonuclease McrA
MIPPVAKSAARQEQTARRRYDPNDKRYKTTAWKKLSLLMRGLNSICQKMPNKGLYKPGEQCHAPSTMTHHIVSPRQRPDLFYVASNLICLCDQCHNDSEGTEGIWEEGRDYVATVLPKGAR